MQLYSFEKRGIVYNYYRDYDPSLGRYIQSDPIGVMQDYSDPQMQAAIELGIPLRSPVQGVNHVYGYVNQNPIFKADPFGLFEWWKGPPQVVEYNLWYNAGASMQYAGASLGCVAKCMALDYAMSVVPDMATDKGIELTLGKYAANAFKNVSGPAGAAMSFAECENACNNSNQCGLYSE